MTTLHFDCFAGISGDMTLDALVDLGVDQDRLCAELAKLGVHGWRLDFVRDERCGISGIRAIVDIGAHNDDDHHHEAHGHGNHEHEEHHREHAHDDHHEHAHNSWKDIRTLILSSELSDGVKKRALDIFARIAEAEAKVHGRSVDEVMFHEVGAIDSIVDVVGAAICLEMLSPDRITASAIELGGGTVRCAHGVLPVPVPAPATLILCQGLPVKTGGYQKEMTTPTGAAILASCVDEFVDTADFTEIRTGYGIGTRKMERPNVLRVSLREEKSRANRETGGMPWNTEELVMIEANIDDMTGESFGFLMERLLENGALDVTMTPCVMKKSRPGTVVGVLARINRLDALRRILFTQSTTIGFRETTVRRISLERREDVLSGKFGKAGCKRAILDGKDIKEKIEFEDRARVARERGLSLENAERIIRSEVKE